MDTPTSTGSVSENNSRQTLVQSDDWRRHFTRTVLNFDEIGWLSDIEMVGQDASAESGSPLQLHFAVLASCSNMLLSIMRDVDACSNWHCCEKPVLILPDFNEYLLQQFMSLLYSGKVHGAQNLCTDVRQLAEVLGVKAFSLSSKDGSDNSTPMSRNSSTELSSAERSRTLSESSNHDGLSAAVEEANHEVKTEKSQSHLADATVTDSSHEFGSDEEETYGAIVDCFVNKSEILEVNSVAGSLDVKNDQVDGVDRLNVCTDVTPDSSSNKENETSPRAREGRVKKSNGVLKNTRGLKRNQVKLTASTPIQCDICQKQFRYRRTMLRHKKSTHLGEGHVCQVCNKQFGQRVNLKRHLKIHLKEKRHRCDVCNESFKTKATMVEHKREHNPLVIRERHERRCSACDATFKTNHSLRKHALSVHGTRLERATSFVCARCRKPFSSAANLKTHLQTHAGDGSESVEKQFLCQSCPKVFSDKHLLGLHMRTHTGEKPFQCEICSKRFSQSGNLIVHRRLHTGDKPYCCPQCGDRFANSTDFTTHIRMHSGDKRHACATCGKKFYRACHLKRHIRVHTGEKSYKCPVCSKPFSDNSGLRRHHLRIHVNAHKKQRSCDETCILHHGHTIMERLGEEK